MRATANVKLPDTVEPIAVQLRRMPPPARWAAIGAGSLGAVGSVVGLVVGLRTYALTAWFAMFELGVPAALLGGLVGFGAGAVAIALRRLRPRR